MKQLIPTRPLVMLMAGLACLSFILPGSATQDEDPFAAWKAEFKRAMSINAKPEMARLVKKDDRMAVGWVIDTCEKISEQSSEELENFIAALQEAWETSMKTDFVRKVYQYFSLMDPVIRRERAKLIEKYEADREKFDANLAKKDGPTFTRLANEFEGYAKAFEEIGDHFFASQAWYFYAECWGEQNRGADGNNFKACAGYKGMLDNRDAIELHDGDYQGVEAWYKRLKAKGFDQDEAAAKAKGGPGPGVVAAASATSVKLGFEMIPEVDTYERPSYYDPELYFIWNPLVFMEKGSTTKFLNIENSPTLYRVGTNDVEIDTDGDGKGDVKIPMTGNIEPVQFDLSVDGKKQPWGFFAVIGNQQSVFQGLQMNLAPSDNNVSIYVLGAGSMLGSLNGVPIRIIDDNMDGIYGSKPQAFGHVGLVVERKMFQPEIDSIVIGDSKRARPWSEFVDVDGQWYHLEPQSAGQELKATEVEVETGTLKLKFKGGKPEWLIVQGTGQFENSYFDVVGGGNKVDVPAGYYKLCFGVLTKGKKQQMLKALMLPGPKTEWKVEEGETTTIELGAPFSFDFDYEVAEDTITVKGTSVHVVGSGTERYGRLWNCVVRPEASYRKEGARKGSKAEKARLLESQNMISDINAKHPGEGWTAAWFPLDIVLDKKANEEDVEVQLTESKNKLFGKIESEWK